MTRSTIGRRLAAAMLLVAGAACADAPGPSGPATATRDLAPLVVSASITGTTIRTLVVTVAAPDIATPFVFNLDADSASGVAAGTLRIPAGSARTITARAMDVAGDVTHEGATTVNVARGGNPAVALHLMPRNGQQPVTLTVADVRVAIAPATDTVRVGRTRRLTAHVIGPDDQPIVGATVSWATSDPSRATVSADGTITGRALGVVTIGATSHGVGALATVVVDTTTPPVTMPPGGVVQLATGGDHACALTQARVTLCWGRDSHGQLGDGTVGGSRALPTRIVGAPAGGFVQLVAGDRHTCGLTDAGAAYCWGADDYAQLGDSLSWDATPRPTLVMGVPAGGFVQLTSGEQHTCGLTAARRAYCWGDNTTGQRGGFSWADMATPVPGAPAEGFVQLAAGLYHTCGLTPVGAVYCWGDNSLGQLGASDVGIAHSPRAVAGAPAGGFTQLVAGLGHNCALTAAGDAYCWGLNNRGQLGNGVVGGDWSGGVTAMARVTGMPAGGYARLAAGTHHSCGVTAEGRAYCWGSDIVGQLGDGTRAEPDERPTPTLVGESVGIPWTRLDLGRAFSCGVSPLGGVYCWGEGLDGQLGDDLRPFAQATPVPVRMP